MNERKDFPACERASDLIAFIYGESGERKTRDFQRHLQQCGSCREEVTSLGVVRESITAWRDEALTGFVSSPVATQPQRKSALAALRQYFDLSPMWLKGATALAAVTFCVLVGLVIFRGDRVPPTIGNSGAVYNAQDVELMVKEALAQQASVKPSRETPPEIKVGKSSRPKAKSSSVASRPLSKAEREQLAAELRLLSSDDDETLHLLGDRINR
jgi:hypothetical protein